MKLARVPKEVVMMRAFPMSLQGGGRGWFI